MQQYHYDFLQTLVAKGGPDPAEYYDLDAWVAEIADQVKTGQLAAEDLEIMRRAMGEACSIATMQGFVYQKPHGYAGDYEIIDRIYQSYVSDQAHLAKWDVYMQQNMATMAVRNRAQYFVRQLHQLMQQTAGQDVQVLNLASGPGRDMSQFFSAYPEARIYFDCIEQDPNAVQHAQDLCQPYLSNIRFHIKNALRFQSDKQYRLIWSAGLFDYFDDKIFVFMLKKLRLMLAPEGEIVIGNFSANNPSKAYMELFEWHLQHRSPNTLKALALKAGFSAAQLSVHKEAAAVNLFLHIRA